MLAEIKCDKFKDGIKNHTIVFKNGLNCVLGAENAVNSIGKSTLLMIIDFCFGGTDYTKKGLDILESIGEHDIYFKFEFDSQKYAFMRSTNDIDFYHECNESYEASEEKRPIKDFQQFLKEHYFGNSIESSFRSIANSFSRIYGKGNYDVRKPLKTYDKDIKDENGIKILVDLFGKSEELKEAIESVCNAKSEKKALEEAKKYGIIHSEIKTIAEYKAAIDEKERLKVELESMIKHENDAEITIDNDLSQKDIDLKSEQIYLMRQKRTLSIQLKTLESMAGDNMLMDENDRRKLCAVFPNFNIKPLAEINDFQKNLSRNVNEEIHIQKETLTNELSKINTKLKEIENELLKDNVSPRISKDFLVSILAKNDEIKKIDSQINLFDKANNAKIKIENAKENLNKRCSDILPNIEETINKKLTELNDDIYTEKRISPALTLKDFSHYTYETPKDRWTGTEFKSLILFDLAILSLTSLPFIINDSMLFKNIWDEPVEGLFKLYDQSKKQIFIAIDRIGVFKKEIQEIINNCTVVKLGDEQDALFGFVWSKA